LTAAFVFELVELEGGKTGALEVGWICSIGAVGDSVAGVAATIAADDGVGRAVAGL
jgi:hypothetical protein